MNPHLKGHAVGGTDHVCRVGENRIQDFARLSSYIPEHVPDTVRFVRVDGEELDVSLFELGDRVAQLREWAVADRSGVAVDEHQHHGLLTLEVGELEDLASRVGQLELWCGLADDCRVHLGEVEPCELLP